MPATAPSSNLTRREAVPPHDGAEAAVHLPSSLAGLAVQAARYLLMSGWLAVRRPKGVAVLAGLGVVVGNSATQVVAQDTWQKRREETRREQRRREQQRQAAERERDRHEAEQQREAREAKEREAAREDSPRSRRPEGTVAVPPAGIPSGTAASPARTLNAAELDKILVGGFTAREVLQTTRRASSFRAERLFLKFRNRPAEDVFLLSYGMLFVQRAYPLPRGGPRPFDILTADPETAQRLFETLANLRPGGPTLRDALKDFNGRF
ncbi:MAG: hypothetical protein ACKVPX_18385 [Myxococcaceae bacterium]